ncbi:MAG TPA: tetratricopeptide repeat protein, partial [Candidatus Latescibacteria bacterium]|nr:tetratricopeptide repeat protein [Candidatus Latescibacterota bacterium]
MTVAPGVYRDQQWIISPFSDLFFFIGTPLLCLVTMLPLRGFVDSQTIAFYALALFATGHHLPGFMRAYGDPELFSTFKEKFVIAPVVVLFVTALAQFNTLHGLFLMVLVWEVWHLFMQHYGIMRIYDAKNKIFARLNARLDWAMTLCAFVTVVIYSPEYFHRILDHNQRVGLPFPSVELTFFLKDLLFYFTMTVFVAYLANIVHRMVTGQKVSLPKVAVMATTVFIIYYGWIHINDLVIGYAAFAVFHDIQYFAIVWVYNNNLVKRQERTTKVLRTFFTTRTLPILAAYMLVSFAYGSINMMEGFLKSEQAINIIEIFVITSTILHYYFDGFIWKMKDRKNQANLGIKVEGGTDRIGAGSLQAGLPRFRSYFREAGRQLVYFALPVAGLAFFQFYWTADEADAREKMVELFPDLAGAHNNLGVFYARLGDWNKASGEYRRALELDGGAYEAHKNLGLLYARQGLLDEAHAHYQQAIDHKPEYVEALNSQGLVFMQRGQLAKAQQRFMEALAEFEYAPAYNNLGTAYLKDKNYMAAIRAYKKAIALAEKNAMHHFNLGLAFQKAVQNEGAVQAFEQAIALQPSYAKAYLSMALSHQRMGNLPAARKSLQRLLQVEPENATAARLLVRL